MVMDGRVVAGVLVPFAGTTLGSAMVFFLRRELQEGVRKALTGFAAGVMVAASFWSLLQPALEEAEATLGRLSFLPASIGFLVGMGFLLLLDEITPHMHLNAVAEGPKSSLKRTTKLILAVTLHNIPEGMAVGVVWAGFLAGGGQVGASEAMALALGIAIQNFPEGAIVSTPLHAEGMGKLKTFAYGTLSGVVEPIAAVLTICFASVAIRILPSLLSFAAGAMLYVVVEELIPEMSEGEHSNTATIVFALGFVTMMILDVALG